ncbi:hypothetical protein C8R45DRAFT_814594 [Mycena sanguinolenta]|nr:hypothetical protein C8R45DRAFT_814594 [Mycena sanguinolenta]
MDPSTLVFVRGIADLGVALILFAKPMMLYEFVTTKALVSVTGLHIANVSVAPGFNHSIACLVASVGLGNLVAARSGPAAPFVCCFLPSMKWVLTVTMACSVSALSLLTCALAPKAWGESGVTLLMGGIVNLVFSAALYLTLQRPRRHY